jgi:uncharacterized protein (DUF1330 family)
MAAYMIFIREGAVFDAGAMERYSGMNRSHAAAWQQRFGIKPLAVYGALETMEGEAPDGVVLLEFPTMADARGWYASDEYQAAIVERKAGANYRAFLFEGLS